MRKQGVATIETAIQYDHDKKIQEAFNFYVKGIGQLMLAIKYEKNKSIRQILLIKISGYIDRAETLKDHNRSPPPQSSSPHENNDTASGVDGDDEKQTTVILNTVTNTKINGGDIDVTWNDVVGLKATKASLYEAVILPKQFPSMFTGKRIPWSAILLYGPPGTGKSFLAKAVAHESKSTFFSISSSDIMSKWQGESEKTVTALFKQARMDSPSVIFIDEVDSLAGERVDGEQESTRRVKTQLLMEMQGVGSSDDSVMILAATNTPWTLDSAFRRRFQRRIFVPLPDMAARTEMFRKGLGVGDSSCVTHVLDDNDFRSLGEKTEGYSGSDVTNVVRSAIMEPIRKCVSAKQFVSMDNGRYRPVDEYPNCAYCPIDTTASPSRGKVCERCGAQCKQIGDLDEGALDIPPVTMNDMLLSLDTMSKTVSEQELDRFTKWTIEFGQDGS